MKDAEKIAREIAQAVKENARADIYGDIYGIDRLEETIATALRSAYSAGYAAAREQAAGVAHNFTGAQHAAHDMKTGVFPKQTYMGEAIADTIRAMEPPNE